MAFDPGTTAAPAPVYIPGPTFFQAPFTCVECGAVDRGAGHLEHHGPLCPALTRIRNLTWDMADALLAILSLPWNIGMASVLACPCCRALFLSDGTAESHRDGCAWLIAAKACGVA